jgi:cell wall-associated NlpC family hydrolase
VRLWDRSWFGLAAAVVAAAASGSAGSALAAGAPPVRASAEAVTILVPGAPAQGSGVVMAFGAGSARGWYRYPKKHAAAVRVGWAKTTATKRAGGSATAAADSLVRRVQLLGGAVRARRIVVSVAVSSQVATASGEVQGLQVLGRHVHPAAGTTIKLSDWGVLDVLDSAQSQAGGSAAASVTGLKLTLVRDHHGLSAGTVIELAAARATITAAPPPPPPPPGGTSTTPRVPQRTHGATLHPRPAQRTTPRHAPAHHPSTHHVRRARHPAAPPPPQAAHALIAATAGDRARVISAALGQVGWPYIWGGDDRADGGFDCSGLVDYAYDHAGLTLPGRPTAAVLWRMSTPVGRARLQPGDLAFLYSRHRAPYHVALYVGDGLVVVAPHTGADVTIEPLAAVAWDGYGRLLRGGRGDGLGLSVAEAARRFAHPGQGERRRLIAGLAADALAAQRVLPPDLRLDGIADGPTQTATAAIVPAPQLIPLASVRAPRAEGAGRVLGFALLLLLVAACLVWAPIRAIRSSGN